MNNLVSKAIIASTMSAIITYFLLMNESFILPDQLLSSPVKFNQKNKCCGKECT